jgi:hypothetical protein
MCEQDVFASRLSYFACHDTVSYYDTTHTSLFINCHATSDFCLGGIHDTSYDTLIVTSLNRTERFNCILISSGCQV